MRRKEGGREEGTYLVGEGEETEPGLKVYHLYQKQSESM